MSVLRNLIGVALALVVLAPAVEAGMARDRNTARIFAGLMPPLLEGWIGNKATISVRGGNSPLIAARRTYRLKDKSRQKITIVYEAKSRGLTYRKDLLASNDKAKRFGYFIKKYGDQLALVRNGFRKREIRLWVKNQKLVLLIGSATIKEMEAYLNTIDFEKLAAVKVHVDKVKSGDKKQEN